MMVNGTILLLSLSLLVYRNGGDFGVLILYPAAAAAAKSLQSCPTLCDPIDGSSPGSPVSLGFSRQEHWSGLPLPSPMHERKSESEVAQSGSTPSRHCLLRSKH